MSIMAAAIEHLPNHWLDRLIALLFAHCGKLIQIQQNARKTVLSGRLFWLLIAFFCLLRCLPIGSALRHRLFGEHLCIVYRDLVMRIFDDGHFNELVCFLQQILAVY